MIEEGQKTVQRTVFPTRDVVRPQFRDQDLLDIGLEDAAVDRSVDDPGCHDAVMAQRCDEGHRISMPEGGATDQALAAQRGHVGLGPGFVDEDQSFKADPTLMRLPAASLAGDIGPFLHTGQRGFF